MQKGKGKVHPRTGHEGPDGKQRYSSTLSLSSALDGGWWLLHAPALFSQETEPVPIVQEAGLVPEPVLDGCGKYRHYRDSILGPSST
jgi:hypothetical protein